MLQVASHDDNAALAAKLLQTRAQLLKVYADLPPDWWRCDQFPYLATVNPPLWEWAHVAWFQEYWCHRHDFARDCVMRPSLLEVADDWVDSRKVAHTTRWHKGHPTREVVLRYMQDTLDQTLNALAHCPSTALYPFRLALYHETMHVEALRMTLQTLGIEQGLGERSFASSPRASVGHPVEVSIAAGAYGIGSPADALYFVFDNERQRHVCELAEFAISSRPTSRAEFREFVERNFDDPAVWSAAGLAWKAPLSDRRSGWMHLLEDRLDEPVERVSAHEAEAFCVAAGRRLPTEFEWEVAAQQSSLLNTGEVWEWTASSFMPFEGFAADPYREYSQPWFGDHRVLKGGSWATHADLKRPAFRNFYLPGRSDVFAGFRTCAV